MSRTSCLLLAAVAGAALTAPASAAVFDPIGDFLPGYTGPRAADLDIEVTEAFRAADGFFLATSHVANPGLTPGSSVTWGINRGAGIPGLFAGTPPVGPNVLFDAVLTIRPLGPVTLTTFNESGPPSVTQLRNATFNDQLLVSFVPFELLPSRGFALADYSFNAWSRSGPGNAGIADLARDAGNFAVVPEPGTWAMLIAGFGMVGAAARRRSGGLVPT